jgi:hypothetical protein
VFHVDSPDWIDKYNHQGDFPLVSLNVHIYTDFIVELECGITGAWPFGGAKLVQEEAPRRLKSSGWTPVRRAISTTVRYVHF